MTALQKKDAPPVVELVIKRVNELQEYGELRLPKDYAAENAVRAAWLVLQEQKTRDGRLVADVASRHSIANAMFNMVVQGLSVIKKQGDFILYGDKLQFQREYHGNKALAARFGKVVDINHATIYKGDVFEFVIDKNGRKQVTKHETKLENISNDIEGFVGAYAIATFEDGSTRAEVMNMQQINKAWLQGANKGQSPAHRNFPDRMAEKTVANRLLTSIINASDDAAMFSADEEQREKPQVEPSAPTAIRTVSFDEAIEVPDDEPQEETPQQAKTTPVEQPKAESKPETPKAEKKAAKQPETLFDDNSNNEEEPF
jgi:recombination protein RecT